ncbi:MAG TPA: DUF1707 and DUF4870 domain-containing protein [Propioniciclava sp.]|jgi:uncharacterized Tic20 family protein|uniref:DUF1707 and DUF4870 domain-containing protein n=1 Tax=Propioniciclava sp. TaxID=2038686 RepID=UPI002CFAE10F|nr:DUF1707 and DUF4870 domain-containing protein [Propioniciclava sp.]HRL50080.1 DUF1707 and DUF4870 domain-containing protein [Propioniciclava sp.]HRL80056.1 DUF1707 and DUF4870 domain-containing protein [Propioniciclava sp.]
MPMDPRTSLSLRVGDADRARAEAVLQEAYSVGRLDERELDVRLGMAMRARTRQELSAALSGLPLQISRPALLNRSAASPDSTLLGSLAHGSAVFTWFVGPLICYGVSTPGTPGRRESARAFNFQLTAGLVILVTMVAAVMLPWQVFAPVLMLEVVGWLLLTVASSARALAGKPLRYPVIGFLPQEGSVPRRR